MRYLRRLKLVHFTDSSGQKPDDWRGSTSNASYLSRNEALRDPPRPSQLPRAVAAPIGTVGREKYFNRAVQIAIHLG
jgi:hypothetical protein